MSTSDAERRDASWDVRNGARNYAELLFNQGVSLVLSFGAASLATHTLGPQGYGSLTVILAVATCVAQLAVQWSAMSLLRMGCEEFVRTGKISQTFWIRTGMLAANLAVVILLAPWWFPWVAGWWKLPVLYRPIVLVHLAVTTLWIHVQYALQGVKLAKLQGRLLTLERAVVCAAVITLIALHDVTPLRVAVAYILAPLGSIALGVYRLRPMIGLPVRVPASEVRKLLLFSLPLISYSMTAYLGSNTLDALILTRYMTRADLGRYTAFYQLTTALLQVPTLASSLLIPCCVTWQSTGQHDRLTTFVRYVSPVMCLVWTLACGIGAVVINMVVPLVFGHEFHTDPCVVWPLMLACAAAGPSMLCFHSMVYAHSRTSMLAMASVAGAVTNAALDLVLIPRFGLPGCAWASAASFAAHSATLAVGLQRSSFFGYWQVSVTLPMLAATTYVAWHGGGGLIALLVCAAGVGVAGAAHRHALRRGIAMARDFVEGSLLRGQQPGVPSGHRDVRPIVG